MVAAEFKLASGGHDGFSPGGFVVAIVGAAAVGANFVAMVITAAFLAVRFSDLSFF